jgi:hypothetical protein
LLKIKKFVLYFYAAYKPPCHRGTGAGGAGRGESASGICTSRQARKRLVCGWLACERGAFTS